MSFAVKEETILDTLNELVLNNRKAQEIYETAAEVVENQYFNEIFTNYAQQRNQFVIELSQLIAQSGSQITDSDSATLSGALQRAWINMNAALRSGDGAIVTECIRGEKSAMAIYRAALNQELPEYVLEVVQHQVSLIRTELEHLETLKTALHNI